MDKLGPFQGFAEFLAFNKGFSFALLVVAALLLSLQVTTSTQEQQGKCTSYAEFLFWVQFSLLLVGTVADVGYDTARFIRQQWNDAFVANDYHYKETATGPSVDDAQKPNEPKFGICCVEYDERVDLAYWCCPCCSCFELCNVCRVKKVEWPTDKEAGIYSFCNLTLPAANSNKITFQCCGLDTEQCFQSSPDDYPFCERVCESILVLTTLVIRLLSNATLALAIPTVAMYNYLHSSETSDAKPPSPPPAATNSTIAAAPPPAHDCFISDNALENLLIGSVVAALALITIRVFWPTWSHAPSGIKDA